MITSNVNTDLLNLSQNKLATSLDQKNITNKKLKEVCDDFESFFVQQMLDVSLKSSKIAGEGVGSEIIKGLYTEGVSKTSNGAFGISNMLYEFLSKNGTK